MRCGSIINQNRKPRIYNRRREDRQADAVTGRRFLFRTVSQIRIAYPGSPLSTGQAGRVAGGDRLPFVDGPGGGNFAPLRSMLWQLHVYGQAATALIQACTELDLPLRLVPWSDKAAAAGLGQDAAYLVRPDGHVGLAMPHQSPRALQEYVTRLGLRFSPYAG